jgi:hypothetical protein
MTLAFSSKDPFVPTVDQGRWIASLSNGSTVFEDKTPGIKSAWLRLRDYVNLHGLKVTNLRLEAFGRRVNLVPYRGESGEAQLNGYFQASRMSKFLNTTIPPTLWRGVGWVKGLDIHICWVDHKGEVSMEVRPLYKKKGDMMSIDLGVIINDPPR